jgi:hypothetical protein
MLLCLQKQDWKIRYLKGEKVFRGYEAFQHSSSGRRSGGVMIFTRRSFNPKRGTIRNSRSGHFTIGAYEYKGEKIVIGGIYGNCIAADGPSAEIFTGYVEWHRELRDRLGDTHAIVAGEIGCETELQTKINGY